MRNTIYIYWLQNRSRYFIAVVLLFCQIFVGCKKGWLEKKAAKNQAIPSTVQDFQALLDYSTYMNANVFSLGEIAADGHFVTEQIWTTATSNMARNAYTWSNQYSYTNLLSWDIAYSRIFNTNLILGELSKTRMANAPKEDCDYIEGQALFSRADAFWMLAQLFSETYSLNTASKKIGIPVRLTADVTEFSSRNTVEETFNQIINDAKGAINLLPTYTKLPTRASLPAALGLLSRVYLYMGKVDSALKYANSCLGIVDTLMDYNNTLPTQSNLGLFNPEVIFHETMTTSEISSFLTTNYFVDKELFDSFDDSDLRKTRFFRINGNGYINFKGNYNNTSALFAGIATDEIYLIRAECFARQNDVGAALKDLNRLLKNRWDKNVNYIPIAADNAVDALEIILRERRKELILRNLRWSDLKRFFRDGTITETIQREIGGKSYSLEANSFKLTFPLPDDVINASKMEQTPGWQ